MSPNLLILGAGISGLRAANLLLDQGFSVSLLEARDRVGGRIHSIHDPRIPVPLELGAEFIHGRPPQTFSLLSQANLAAYDVADSHRYLRGKKLTENPKFWDQIEQVMGRLSRYKKPDISFEKFLHQQRDLSPAALRKARDFVRGFDAADTVQIGVHGLALAQKASEKINGDSLFRPLGGYHPLIKFLHTRLQNRRVPIHLSTIVQRIEWSPRICQVTALVQNKTKIFTAEKILITLPLGVLQSGDVTFSPMVPRLAESLAAMQMGGVVKALFQFKKPFWETEDLQDLSFFHASDLAFPTWWTQLPMRLPLLTAWAGGPKALDLSELSEKQILDRAIRSLSRFFNRSNSWIARQLEMHWIANWPRDPFAHGAYSYVGVAGLPAARQFCRLGQTTLFFAGEHTAPDLIGTVAAALASAERAVQAVCLVRP